MANDSKTDNTSQYPSGTLQQKHLHVEALVLSELHDFPLDLRRLERMVTDLKAGAQWAWHPVAVVKTEASYTIIDGRLRALARQAAGHRTIPCHVHDLVREEWAAFRWAGSKNRHTRPIEVAP